jgi:hypothetical protein
MTELRSASRREVIRFPGSRRPLLIVIVDTEEEFDWNAPFDRRSTQVSAMDEIGAFQDLCESFGIKPAYVVDYPIATQERGFRPLRAFAERGRAEIGAHLHPWVTPPFDEEVNPRNSYPGNLAPDLERAKLRHLVEAIQSNLGVSPRLYKAGRYGIGPSTPKLLEELGFEIDMSVCASFDLSADGGPDYSEMSADPFWLGSPRRFVLEIPNTGGFVGTLGAWSSAAYRLASRPPWQRVRVPGLLSRLGLVERLLLSPEGFTPQELRRLTGALWKRGLRVFTFSLHSPSLKPGCTPYVRSREDREQFLERCRGYFEFFLEELGGTPTTPLELRCELSGARP